MVILIVLKINIIFTDVYHMQPGDTKGNNEADMWK